MLLYHKHFAVINRWVRKIVGGIAGACFAFLAIMVFGAGIIDLYDPRAGASGNIAQPIPFPERLKMAIVNFCLSLAFITLTTAFIRWGANQGTSDSPEELFNRNSREP